MLIKYLFILIFYVYGISSLSNFIDEGHRAKLFELTDNEVATFRITISDDDFTTLKEKVVKNVIIYNNIEYAKFNIENFFLGLRGLNFTEVFPDYDFNMILPELKIGEDGYSKVNYQKIFNELDFNIDHYYIQEDQIFSLIIQILMGNPEINFLNIFGTISMLDMNENAYVEPFVLELLNSLKNMSLDFKKKRGMDNNDYTKFKIKNSSLKVEINGEQKIFDKVTFTLTGHNSVLYPKPGFNIKIRDGKDLYGCNQFKIRSDSSEPTFLRTKLMSDIHNHLGLPTVSSNYITLYINNEYMGLYTLNEAIKSSWIKSVYGEENTTSLYKCNYLIDFKPEYSVGCTNENEDVNENESNKELEKFLEKVETAESVSDLEDIFEIDHFLNEIALDFLSGSYDHIQNDILYHNFSFYKQKNGKWIYLPYDFDLDMGIIPTYTILESLYYDFTKSNKLLEVLIFKDSSRFENILKNIVNKVFNPATLYPHIDELKQLIRPYVKLDKTPDADGNYPGYLNHYSPLFFSFEEWDANSEFTSVQVEYPRCYGLKHWILLRYRFVCNQFNMECDPVYMDENYEFPINKNVEFFFNSIDDMIIYFEKENTTLVPEESSTLIPEENTTVPSVPTQSTFIINTTSIIEPTSSPSSIISKICRSELIGYECCPTGITTIYTHDEYGDWSYDFNKNEWCGLTIIEEESNIDECWSEEFGYPCCKSCIVYEVNSNGQWGYEFNQWCGIPLHCSINH